MSSSPLSRLGHRGIAPALSTRLALGYVMQSQWSARRFLRYDLALRSLTARHLLGAGDSGSRVLSWYQKMQQDRAGKDTLPAFQALVETISHQGLSAHYPVGLSARGELLDGAHRTAVALALNAYDIAVDVRRGKRLRPYGREWFRHHGFTEEALVAMDHEVERLMVDTGADTLVVAGGTDEPLREWIPSFFPSDTEVMREWSVSLPDDDMLALDQALSFVPWHEKDRQRDSQRVLPEGQVSVLRLRLHSPKRIRIPKTATAQDQGAVEMQRSIRAALPHYSVIVGQSVSQNRDAAAILARHGFSSGVGQPWT